MKRINTAGLGVEHNSLADMADRLRTDGFIEQADVYGKRATVEQAAYDLIVALGRKVNTTSTHGTYHEVGSGSTAKHRPVSI